ncbi:hypothetical protein GTGU_04222 [Trabulsiella guamensis ATCC 49490]|uniref:Uncharacterized protein n=1 Tax=Trabulsiella guamensis ATCC 49490 TaxID=1005994 RepID=A0A084ZP26_9ENTR|nr:hypothetical protein GTGU_04222 [Trabulsiella guamensis ATCC 49490]
MFILLMNEKRHLFVLCLFIIVEVDILMKKYVFLKYLILIDK